MSASRPNSHNGEHGAAGVAHPVASPGWLSAMRETVRDELAEIALFGLDILLVERFEEAPASFATRTGEIFEWYVRIRDGQVTVGEGVPADVRSVRVMPYELAQQLGRLRYAPGAEHPLAREATVAGTMRLLGTRDAIPDAVAAALHRVHNHMAGMTQ